MTSFETHFRTPLLFRSLEESFQLFDGLINRSIFRGLRPPCRCEVVFHLYFSLVRSFSAGYQPLTKLPKKKCKRCGFYEKDSINSDDILDEWELCPSYFTDSDGKYRHFKEKEFNATFLCPKCESLGSGGKGMHLALVIIIGISVSTVFILGLVVAYKYWQKRKREQDQARFLKLFEDDDNIEDELGIGPLGSVLYE